MVDRLHWWLKVRVRVKVRGKGQKVETERKRAIIKVNFEFRCFHKRSTHFIRKILIKVSAEIASKVSQLSSSHILWSYNWRAIMSRNYIGAKIADRFVLQIILQCTLLSGGERTRKISCCHWFSGAHKLRHCLQKENNACMNSEIKSKVKPL